MGWHHLAGADPGQPAHHPARSGRTDFARAVYPDRFRAAVSRLNPGPGGRPWLTGAQLDQLWELLDDARTSGSGIRGHLAATELLRKGVNAQLLTGWRKGDPEHVRLVDWENSLPPGEGNDLLVVSELRVERQDGRSATPDLVLFVNGLPWVVIECKAPGPIALDQAVSQVIGYAGAHAEAPVPDFVRYAQLLVATDRERAELGTVTSGPEHFAPWRTVEPATEDQVRQETGTPDDRPLSAQAVLVAGVLRPDHLLRLVRDFTTHTGTGSGAAKIVGRYQQFRAVGRLARRLRARLVTLASGRDPGNRGGVIWHTQGSGKSLTMAFLVRHLRSSPSLRRHKIVVVSDRIDLEKQIRRSLGAAEEEIHRAATVEQARRFLAVDVPDLVLIMIQKSRRDDAADDGTPETLDNGPDGDRHLHNRVANDGAEIVVLVDEAHRSHPGWQHARLRAMLPNAAFIGFTGTPVIDQTRKTTREIFGDFADLYTLRDAERDGAVVPVRYEAHHVALEVIEKVALDARFETTVPSDPERRERVLRRFARRKEVLESSAVIACKAEHMLRHWARTALPDGFGAQVVAVSRKAAVEYQRAIVRARDTLLAELDALDPDIVHDPMAHEYLSDDERALLYLLPHRHLLAAVVISEVEGKADPAEWRRWKLKSRHDDYIERFKQGIDSFRDRIPSDPSWAAETHGGPAPAPPSTPGPGTGEPWHREQAPSQRSGDGDEDRDGAEEGGPVAFLVVQSMLLTGFDAPVEQVLYLDRKLTGVELLQAIARTNRPYRAKEWGQVVDYVGIGPELAKALTAYDREHLREVYGYRNIQVDHLQPDYDGEQPTADQPWLETDAAADRLLRELAKRVQDFLDRNGTASLDTEEHREDLLAALENPLLRGKFDNLVRDFLTSLNAVLPRPRALPYEGLARRLGEVQYLARQRYRDDRDQFSPRRYGAKVRRLIARHLEAGGVEERIPPVEISDPAFMDRVRANPDPRARTAYLTSRLRMRIEARIGGDRVRYQRFSERLEEIVRSMAEDFEAAAAAMQDLVEDIRAADEDTAAPDGLDPYTERPVHSLLEETLKQPDGTPLPPGTDLVQASRDLTVEIAGLVHGPHFGWLPESRDRVRRELRHYLEDRLNVAWGATGPLASLLVELAEARHGDFRAYARRRGR